MKSFMISLYWMFAVLCGMFLLLIFNDDSTGQELANVTTGSASILLIMYFIIHSIEKIWELAGEEDES